MTEQEYIITADLTRLRLVNVILREMIPECVPAIPDAHAKRAAILRQIIDLTEEYNKALRLK